jgi:Zn-dependent protease with chaperone function
MTKWLCCSALAAQPSSQIEQWLMDGRAQGMAAQQSNDNRALQSAKKLFENAEKSAVALTAKQPACEVCWEQLAAARFYQAYWKFSRNYEEFLETAGKALAKFPSNTRMLYFRGYAHYNLQNWKGANRDFNLALQSPGADPKMAESIRPILSESSNKFLTSWNRQADYYRLPESRLESVNPQNGQRFVYAQITPEWELQLGAMGFAQLSQQAKPLADPEVQTYVEGLIAKLTSATHGPFQSYKVTLLENPEVNAVTLPGHVIVNHGLLRYVDSEAELIAVLAHELAHNYGHHQARAYLKMTSAQYLAAGIARAVNPQAAWQQLAMQAGAQFGMQMFSRAYSRFEEKEADLYGAHLMYNAGYNPIEASAFFLKLSKLGDKGGPRFLRTHPASTERAADVAEYLESFPVGGKEFRVSSAEFKRMKEKIGGANSTVQPGKALPPL